MPDHDNETEKVVPIHFRPGMIVLALAVSYVGALTTIELLHRRANHSGWIKWTQLLSCAVAFGFVCAWAMAMVANNAICFGDAAPDNQVFYHPAFVVLSAIVPVIISFLAFVLADLRFGRGKRRCVSLAAVGPTSGLAIVAMHYIGSLGAINYSLTYPPSFIAGAIVVACVSCTAVFSFVFKIRESRLTSLRWRLLCALILAIGVTSMHLEALIGTIYKQINPDKRAPLQRSSTLILAVFLTGVTIIMDLALLARFLFRRKKLADRALQVVLACARFDHEGKIMVTREGMLPCRKITAQDNQQSFDDDFSNSHEAFQWIFRVSNDWNSIQPWLRAIRSHLRAIEGSQDPLNDESDNASLWSVRPGEDDYSVVFKESFCIAASNLAADLREPLQELGRVFDAVMTSGSRGMFSFTPRTWFVRLCKGFSRPEPGEASMDIFGKGQVVFAVKRMDRKDIPKFQSMGYRFMPVGKVVPLCADIMQIPDDYLHSHLIKARASALDMDAYKKPPGGVFLACFAVKPGLGRKTWEVLVNKQQSHKLPSVPLWSQAKMKDCQQFLEGLDGQSVIAILNHLEQRTFSLDREEEVFAKAFRRAILELAQLLAEPFFKSAVLCSKVIQAPVSDYTGRQTHCTLLCFHVVPDIHTMPLHNPDQLAYLPLTFFKVRQQTLDQLPVDLEFRERVQQEFMKRFAGRQYQLLEVKAALPSYRWSAFRQPSKGEAIGLRNLSIVSMQRGTFFENASVDGDRQSLTPSLRTLTTAPTMTEASSPVEDEKRTSSRAALLPPSPTYAKPPASFVDELFAVATAKWAKR